LSTAGLAGGGRILLTGPRNPALTGSSIPAIRGLHILTFTACRTVISTAPELFNVRPVVI
jgi:hypothetical protein